MEFIQLRLLTQPSLNETRVWGAPEARLFSDIQQFEIQGYVVTFIQDTRLILYTLKHTSLYESVITLFFFTMAHVQHLRTFVAPEQKQSVLLKHGMFSFDDKHAGQRSADLKKCGNDGVCTNKHTGYISFAVIEGNSIGPRIE
jgi:hypothetical protein